MTEKSDFAKYREERQAARQRKRLGQEPLSIMTPVNVGRKLMGIAEDVISGAQIPEYKPPSSAGMQAQFDLQPTDPGMPQFAADARATIDAGGQLTQEQIRRLGTPNFQPLTPEEQVYASSNVGRLESEQFQRDRQRVVDESRVPDSNASEHVMALMNAATIGNGPRMYAAAKTLTSPGDILRNGLSDTIQNYLEEGRIVQARGREERPGMTFAEEIIPSILAGKSIVDVLQEGPKLFGRQLPRVSNGYVRTSVTGGTLGATYAGSQNESGDIEQAGTDAAIGGATGAVLGPGIKVGADVARVPYRWTKATAAKLADAVVGVFGKQGGMTQAHYDQVAVAALRRSMERSGMTPEKIIDAVNKFGDKPAVLAEVIGQDAVNALVALTRKEGATPELAEGIIADRFGNYAARAGDDLRQTTGLTDRQIEGDFTPEISARREAAQPVYDAAFEAFPEIADPRLEQLKGSPILQKAISAAKKGMKTEAAAAGKNPDEMSQLQFWDLVKRELDDQYNLAQGDEARRLVEVIRKPVVETLDRLTGGEAGAYVRAREAGSAAPALQSAYRQGWDAWFPKTRPHVARNQAAEIAPENQEAFRAGMAGQIDSEIQRNIPPHKFRTPATQAKVKAVFGEEAGRSLIHKMEAEAKLRDLGARWAPNKNSVSGTVLENNPGNPGMARMVWAFINGNVRELAIAAESIMRRRGYSEKERDAIGRLLLSDPQEGLRLLGVRLPNGGAPANALAPSTRGKPPEPNTARDPQNVRAQFEHPGDIESYDAAGNAKFKPGSKGEAMARGVNALARNEAGFMRPDAAGTMMTAGGAGVGAMNPIDFDGDGKTSAKERAMTAALYGGGAYAANRGVHGLDRLGRAPKGAATEFRVRPGESGSSKIQFRAGGERWADIPTGFGSEAEATAQMQRLQAGKPLQADVLYGPPKDEFEAMFRSWFEQTQGRTAPRFAEAIQNNNGLVGKALWEMDPSGETFARYLQKYDPEEWAQYMGPGGGADGKSFDAALGRVIDNLGNEVDSMTRPSGSNAGRDFNLETWNPNKPKSSGPAMFRHDLANAAVGGTVGGMGGSFSGEFTDYNGDGVIDETDKQIGFMIGTGLGAFGAPIGTRFGTPGNKFTRGAGPSGKPPKLMPDVPKGTRKPGQKPNISGTIQRGQEQSSSVPIAKAIGGEGLAYRTAKREAEDMMARNVDLEEIQRRTGLVPISYRGQMVWRGVDGEVTAYEANELFYEALKLPPAERPEWVKQVLDEIGPKVETLNLGGKDAPLRLGGPNTPMRNSTAPNNVPRNALLGGLGAVGVGTAYYMSRDPKR